MKRRKALQHLGLGLSGGILLPSLLDSCSKNDPAPEFVYTGTVAVVGAGAAGLYVADILRTKGVKVNLYEARDQIGGRVRSLRNQPIEKYPMAPQLSSDFPIELGAETIIGSDTIFGKIYKDYNLQTTEYLPASSHYILENQAKSESEWGTDPDFVAAKNFRANLKNNSGSSQSVQQAIVSAGINSRAYGMLNGTIGNAYGANNEQIGIGELAEEEKIRVSDGKLLALTSNPMQDAIISRFSNVQLSVKLNTPITAINYASDPIILTAKDGTTYEANKVIVTVPVSMLKNNSISFTPGLPASMTGSLAKLGMGASMRAVLEFKKNFWGETAGFIFGSSNMPEYFSMGLGRSKLNTTLSVTVSGNKAVQYSALGDGVIDAILADLDLIYAGQGSLLIRQDIATLKNIFVREDWTKIDYILGGYSYPLPGASMADRKAIGQPVNSKLFFAGEATDVSGMAGMVNGALASGERAAQEVIDAIKAGL